ncbi:MAG TPA: hypothetical protein VEI02_02150, partial [Planctomycetota bacterium]|nr:hypothetical protein [Planctomycetota bacterium]
MPRTLPLWIASLLAAGAAAQGTLTLSATTHPDSFDHASSAPCAPAALTCFDELLRTEPLTFTLSTVPTMTSPPPVNPPPRRLAIWLGGEFPPGFPLGAFLPGLTSPNLVYLDPAFPTAGGVIVAAPVIDSFFSPFGPVFGPPLTGPTNTFTVTLGLDLLAPQFHLPASGAPLTLVVQAIAEDVAGSPTPILLSNALELNLVDPEANHPPTPTALDPPNAVAPSATRIFTPFSGPLGLTRSEGFEGGGDVLVIDGAKFPSQTNWIAFPPSVTFKPHHDGGVTLTGSNVVVLSPTRLAVTPPTLATTAPPFTQAGFYDVFVANHPAISPSATPHPVTGDAYLYRTGLFPTIASFVVAPAAGSNTACVGPQQASPSGGDQLTLVGSNFLVRSAIRLTPLLGGSPAPGTAPWRFCPPDSAYGAGGGSVTFTLPPIRSGEVLVEIIAPDEAVAVAPTTLQVCDLQPALINLAPTFASTPLGAPPLPAVSDAGGVLTLLGLRTVTPSSPLFGAQAPSATAGPVPPATAVPPACAGTVGPTVPAGAVAPTRFEIAGAPSILAPIPTFAPELTSLFVPSFDDDDDVRPFLGIRQLRAYNPPAVSSAGGEIPSPPVDVLLQDEAPPSISSIFPDVSTSGRAVGACPAPAWNPSFSPDPLPASTRIVGGNFFTRDPGVRAQGFVAPPTLAELIVPAVRFDAVGGGFSAFAFFVELIDTSTLDVALPLGIPQGVYQITVINPDGRFASATATLLIVPPLTDPCALTDPRPGNTFLDEALLFRVLDLVNSPFGAVSTPVPPADANKALPENLFALTPFLNPSPFLDQLDDQTNGTTPAQAAPAGVTAYDLVFLFNTRRRTTGDLRPFDFDFIDLPATITLPSPIGVPTIDGNLAFVGAGVKRVVVKAAAFDYDAVVGKFRWFYEDNFPFILRAKLDLRCDAMLDLAGDAFLREQGLLGGSPLAFLARHDWSPPPAGAGAGGRGGSYYCSTASTTGAAATLPSLSPGCQGPTWGMLPYAPSNVFPPALALPPVIGILPSANASLGTPAFALAGAPGFPPQMRADPLNAVAPSTGPTAPVTGGAGGGGVAPTGGRGG